MGKIVAVILALAMIVHIIRPLGLPGLKRRQDAWKIAVFAFLTVIVVASLQPG